MDYRLVVKEHAAKTWLDCKIEEETWRTARHGYDVLVEITESSEGATMAVHVQKALYSEKGAELLCRSYANILKQVVDKGSHFNTSRMEKWNAQDVHTALAIGKGRGHYKPPLGYAQLMIPFRRSQDATRMAYDSHW
jgi:hybrid polyketide synthase/nonribosomal peptide synthetase ACE1